MQAKGFVRRRLRWTFPGRFTWMAGAVFAQVLLGSCVHKSVTSTPLNCDGVEIIRSGEPQRPFKKVEKLHAHLEETFFVKPRFADLVDDLKRQACERGADAIYGIDERSWTLNETGAFHLTAIAIKYTDLARAPTPSTAEVNAGAAAFAKERPAEPSAESLRGLSSVGKSQLLNITLPTYHGLIIANSKYRYLRSLDTPPNDARELSTLLVMKYGFRKDRVKVLLDATRSDIAKELARLRGQLSQDDSLLIYYAGHGRIDTVTERGYWLPVDAETSNEANWFSNDDITNYLKGMQARHVLIISDSCYSGTLVRSGDMSPTRVGSEDEWIRRMLTKRARTALTSGGLEPVRDRGGGQYSVFAKALIDVLSENSQARDMESLFQDVKRRVVLNAEQTPNYADIRLAGHDFGDFVLVPR